MKDRQVWLVGNRGMLGTEVEKILQDDGIPYFGTDLEVDITDLASLKKFSERKSFSWIVNCAAYTAVDDAEANENLAYAINAVGPKNLAVVAESFGAPLIHISTDYVFNGVASSPYTVNAAPEPGCVYGETKLAGEQFVRKSASKHIIVRTAWLYGKNGKNFVSTMLRLMQDRDSLSIVNDQRGTPTYAVDLARAVAEFIKQDTKVFGLYHYTNAGQTTWYEFAVRIYEKARQMGLIHTECSVSPIPSSEYPTKARRPFYSVLDCTKIERALGLSRPDWEDGLDRYLNKYLEEIQEDN